MAKKIKEKKTKEIKKAKKENILEIEANKVLLLSIHKFFIIAAFWVLSLILHNLLSGKAEEPFFFIVAIVIIPVYLLISAIYTSIHAARRKNLK